MTKLNLIKRLDRESGQGAVEYLGVIVVAVIILAALAAVAPDWGANIVQFIDTGIERIGVEVNS